MNRARPNRRPARASGLRRRRRRAPGRPRVAVLIETPEWSRRLRTAAILARRAVRAALAADRPAGAVELSVVLTNNRAVRRLNRDWRGQDKPTNVLSFPAGGNASGAPRLPPGVPAPLGDVVVACGVAADEAAAQGKSLGAHLAHLVVHGVLHLLGHDHEADAEAERMEALEARILRRLGIANPYRPSLVRDAS